VRGTISVWKLLPEVVEDLAPLPVLASGGPPRGQRPGEGTSIGTRTNVMGQRVEWMRYAVGSAPPDFDGDIEYAPLWAGESCSVVNDIKPAAEIVRDLVRGAETALAGA
jgi:NAD(P)H-dependent flavin oxidoreductase YrpB (nitropropane dioxygenase family)